METIRLLVADENETIRKTVRQYAASKGYRCSEAGNGIMALKLFRHGRFALAVLNIHLAELDGFLVCRQIRKTSGLPILFLTNKPSDEQCIAAFQAGGNDYIRCPVAPLELAARIGSFLRISASEVRDKQIVYRDVLSIHPLSRKVSVNDQELQLTPKEYDLLLFFAENPNKAFNRNTLLNRVWGDDFFGTDRTVDTHIKLLREHLKPYGDLIATVWGFGYKFEP